MKALIRWINNLNWTDIVGYMWLITFCINTFIVWTGPFYLDPNGEFYLFNLCLALFVGFLGIGTFFLPFIILNEIWERLSRWSLT